MKKYKIGDPFDPNKRDFPADYIKKTLDEYFYSIPYPKGNVIVEIGTMRMPLNHPLEEINIECCQDGHSTAWWAQTGKEVYSVDIDPAAIQNCVETLDKLGHQNVHVLNRDGIQFLKDFNKPIDLLFLDAWDVDLPNSCEKHLEAYEVAKSKLHKYSLILIDDTDVERTDKGIVFANGLSGKGKLVIPKALDEGWEIVLSGRQTLLSRK